MTDALIADKDPSAGLAAQRYQTRLMGDWSGPATYLAPERTRLHATVRFYASSEFDTKSFEFGGAGELTALLAFLRTEFTSIELALDEGVSQGHTSTFRGKARVVRGGEKLSYMFRCGFRSSGKRIDESWVEMQVPPTLREAFE